MVVMAFDEKGQATDFARKTEICARAYRLLTREAGIPPEDIIFDVNILSIASDAPQDVISTLSGKIGKLPGVTAKTAYSNVVTKA